VVGEGWRARSFVERKGAQDKRAELERLPDTGQRGSEPSPRPQGPLVTPRGHCH
jgi:hypothetical protein